jgi:hypothetical protein
MCFVILKSTLPGLSFEYKHKLLALLQKIWRFHRYFQSKTSYRNIIEWLKNDHFKSSVSILPSIEKLHKNT